MENETEKDTNEFIDGILDLGFNSEALVRFFSNEIFGAITLPFYHDIIKSIDGGLKETSFSFDNVTAPGNRSRFLSHQRRIHTTLIKAILYRVHASGKLARNIYEEEDEHTLQEVWWKMVQLHLSVVSIVTHPGMHGKEKLDYTGSLLKFWRGALDTQAVARKLDGRKLQSNYQEIDRFLSCLEKTQSESEKLFRGERNMIHNPRKKRKKK